MFKEKRQKKVLWFRISQKKIMKVEKNEWNLGNAAFDEGTGPPYQSPGENPEHFFSILISCHHWDPLGEIKGQKSHSPIIVKKNLGAYTYQVLAQCLAYFSFLINVLSFVSTLYSLLTEPRILLLTYSIILKSRSCEVKRLDQITSEIPSNAQVLCFL